MFSFCLRLLHQLAQAMRAHESPRRMAGGFVLGMLLGLLPIGNLVVAMLAMLLFGLRVNKPAGLMAACVFSLIGFTWEPFAHHVGALVLLWEPARPAFAGLYHLPFGPWLGLNNTVVVGQLALGLYLAYPVYWLVWQYGKRVQPRLHTWLARSKAVSWLHSAEFSAHWGYDS